MIAPPPPRAVQSQGAEIAWELVVLPEDIVETEQYNNNMENIVKDLLGLWMVILMAAAIIANAKVLIPGPEATAAISAAPLISQNIGIGLLIPAYQIVTLAMS